MMLGMTPAPEDKNMNTENTTPLKKTPWSHVHPERLKVLPEGWEFCSYEEAEKWLKIMNVQEIDKQNIGKLYPVQCAQSPYDALYLPVKKKTT